MQTSDKVSDPENEDNQTPTNYFSLPVLERPNSSKLHLNNSEATCTFCTSLADGGINWFSVIWGGMTGISSHSINAVLFDYCLHF